GCQRVLRGRFRGHQRGCIVPRPVCAARRRVPRTGDHAMRNTLFPILALSIALAPGQALAQSGGEPAWSVGGSVTAATDYVWRGVSQTNEDPALMLDLYAGHESGWYAGASAANVDFDDPEDGMDYELAPYVGWA